jgi:hypothetical protein
MFFVCVFHDKSHVIVIPLYFNFSATFILIPPMV